uniref:Blcap n=1 Tax=Ciona intestinalis TaxID=7719 RepID=Q8MXX3_CIOIN|nr:blcap protein [Ciona intestinalis]BAC10334.1 blcap [Ciona intestinalis]|eukprot:NP_001027654.1 blcap protein [Ciona intestinalis]
MYCLQWLLPVLLLPCPANPALYWNHFMFLGLYLTSFYVKHRPCIICSLVFFITMFMISYSNCHLFIFRMFNEDCANCEFSEVDVTLDIIHAV